MVVMSAPSPRSAQTCRAEAVGRRRYLYRPRRMEGVTILTERTQFWVCWSRRSVNASSAPEKLADRALLASSPRRKAVGRHTMAIERGGSGRHRLIDRIRKCRARARLGRHGCRAAALSGGVAGHGRERQQAQCRNPQGLMERRHDQSPNLAVTRVTSAWRVRFLHYHRRGQVRPQPTKDVISNGNRDGPRPFALLVLGC